MHSGVISQMLADGAPAAAQSYLANEVPRGELPPALQQGLQGKVNVAVADNISDGIMNAYRSPGGMIAGNKALASIDARQDLPDDVKDQIRSDVQGSLDKRRNEARQTMGPAIEQLEEHISSGQVDPADRASVWSLYNAGAFGPSEAGSAIGRLEKAQQDQVQADAWHQQLDQAYQQGHPLDPKDKDIKAGISDLFTQYTKGIDPGTPEWMNRGADIAAKTGVTPQPVIDWARTQLVSGEPDAAAQAAEAIERQSGANPRGLSYAIDPQTKAMAKIVNDAVQAGTPSDAAVENARSISSINDAERTRLETLYKAQVKSTTPLGSLTNEIAKLPGYDQGWFSSNPTIPPAMTGEFQELQHQYFLLTSGNGSQANDLAMADLKHTWGISRVNGAPELMQYAPEAMRPGLPVDALRADIEASAAGHTPDPTKVKLLTTAETGESGGSRFALGAPDQFGAYHVLSDEKGRPLTYAIPDFTNDVKDAQAKAAAAGMQRLKAKQAEAKEREQALIDSIKSAQDIGGVM